ncbi:uncharacterized protein LOC135826976 [Sycon ciliatum]|uniref:uncharacterized protein LOC135826976 n=1 Tax=Sycon ciliatum TaxID=27933 RepID=UPI0031F712F3
MAGKTTPTQQVPIQRKSQASQNPGQFPRTPAVANAQVSKYPGLSGMTPPTPPVPDQRKSQTSQSPGQSQQTSPATDEVGSAYASVTLETSEPTASLNSQNHTLEVLPPRKTAITPGAFHQNTPGSKACKHAGSSVTLVIAMASVVVWYTNTLWAWC